MILNNLGKDIIYHYTNFTALESILRTRTLWLSHSSCLNDFSEGVHGMQKIFQALKDSPKNQNELSFITNLQKPLEKAAKEVGFYVISFCEDGDSLVQWRSYATDGCGVAIGFDVNKLKSFCEAGGIYTIGKCGYSDLENPNIFRNVYSQVSANYGTVIDNDSAICIMAITSAFLKHTGFIAEQECRIVAAPKCKKNYRTKDSRIIPYHILHLGDAYSWLKDILVGPCNQQLSIGKATEALLEEFKIDTKDKVKYSDIPYRGLRNY